VIKVRAPWILCLLFLGAVGCTSDASDKSDSQATLAAVVIRSGQVAVVNDGVATEPQISVSADGLEIAVAETSVSVRGIALTDDQGTSVLAPGQTLEVAAEGFQPDSQVEMWVFSTPRLIATFRVETSGRVEGSVEIPNDLESGNHQLQFRGPSSQGAQLVVAISVSIQDGSADAPAEGSTEPTANNDSSGQNAGTTGGVKPAVPGETGQDAATERAAEERRAAERAAQERQAADRAAAEQARQAAERAAQERQAAERAAAERAVVERAEADRRAAARQAAEAEAARRAAADAESEVLVAARTHAEAVTQQEAARVAASSESTCRRNALSPTAANICPGRGRRAGEEYYEQNIGTNIARFEYEFMARDYNAVYERYLRQYLAEIG